MAKPPDWLTEAPMMMPIGVERINRIKKPIVNQWQRGRFFVKNVVPTVYATGILWITMLAPRTAISPISLKAPIARPSKIVWRMIAKQKTMRVEIADGCGCYAMLDL